MPDSSPNVNRSLWYAFHERRPVTQIPIVATVSKEGNCSIMCTVCGHVFVDGAPFTGESNTIGHHHLAMALYYHSCDDEGARTRK